MARIALIDLCFNWPPLGGSWVDVESIARILKLRGHEPMLFVPLLDYGFPRGRIDSPLSFPFEQIPFSRYSYNLFHAPARMRKAVRAFKPDSVFITDGHFLKPFILHALREYHPIVRFYAYEIFCIQNNRYMGGRNCFTHLLGRDRRVCLSCQRRRYPLGRGFLKLLNNEPQYFVFHEYMMSLAFLPIYPLLFRMFMREAESVIVYNTIQKQILQPFHPNVIVAPSGVDTDLFSPRPSSREGPFTIGLAGRYYEEGKGLELALAACRLLRSQGVEFTLLVASPRLEGYRDDFLHYCGWYDREKLPEFYSRCDVIVVPSMWEEPFGITAVEALSCGIPVIASSSGALPTIVDDGVTGFLFPRGDAGALADRMMRLAKDPGLARRMGAAAREKALKAYRWDAIMEKIYLPLFGGDGRYG